jgi:8-oxo-dGTP pyrophosphatase MutT (NUDIX family)
VGDAVTPAATVVPLRDDADGLEVLLLRRNDRGPFGGMWVFPGGRVDAGDGDAAAEIATARRAAVREAAEESGLELDEGALVTLSFWLPPAEAPRRFATWFFLAPAGDHLPVVVDDGEIHEHRWLRPAAAMAAHQGGEINLAPPTFTTLWWLSHHPDVASAVAAAAARPPERFMTRLAFGPDGRLLATLWDGDAGYADGDPDRPGPRRRLWLDPAGWRIEITV